MPGTAPASYPAFSARTVYVSGESEMNRNSPAESLLVVAACCGETAVTFAPAIGAPVVESTTRPRSEPVFEARAGSEIKPTISAAKRPAVKTLFISAVLFWRRNYPLHRARCARSGTQF